MKVILGPVYWPVNPEVEVEVVSGNDVYFSEKKTKKDAENIGPSYVVKNKGYLRSEGETELEVEGVEPGQPG